MNKLTLDENAKEDWLKLVKKHKKKQKGLSALSTLNTNAGDAETHIKMFNKMTSPTESPNNNPVSGPFGGDVSSSTEVSGGLAESVDLFEGKENFTEGTSMNKEKVELYYTDLDLDDVPTGKVVHGRFPEPDEYITKNVTTDYSYYVDKDWVIEALGDLSEVQEKYWLEGMSSEEYEEFLVDNFDDLFDEFEKQILDHFREYAEEDARNDFDPDDYFSYEPDYDPSDRFYESKETVNENLDDIFDMSLRAIL